MSFREELPVNIVHFQPYTVSNVPNAVDYMGAMIFVSDGAAGAATMAFSDGTNWLRTDNRAAISAS